MYKIMIVEDDPMVAMINEQFVNRCGDFSVTHRCSNGEDALAILEREPIDLVIMDVYMPRLDGIETLKKIREKDIPLSVIMVTAANDNSTVEEAVRLGAIDYLVKPFTFDRFKQALEKFRSGKQVLDADRTLDQKNIDILLGNAPAVRQEQEPKGIQDKTRERLMDCLAVSGEWLTGEEISERTELSVVTVRKYMNYLVDTGEVQGRMNYETGGRPCMLYRVPLK
jgi:response regulator of citrate/malate metabolism